MGTLNEYIFHIIRPLGGESIDNQWIHLKNDSEKEL